MRPSAPDPQELDRIRREAIEFAGIGLYRYRFDGTVLLIDRGAMRILDLEGLFASPEELAGRDIGTLLIYTGPRGYLRERVREAGHVRGLEYPFRTLTGEDRWAEHDSYLVSDPVTGEEQIQVIIQDITARKRAELELAAERERLEVTLRSIGDGVISTDEQGRVTLLNRMAERLTGWTQEEARGRPLGEVFRIVNERTREPAENPVEKVLRTGEIVGLANHTALIGRDGSERSIADSGAPIRDPQGRTIGVVLVFRDITERLRLEADHLRIEKLESLGLLAGGIAHDFNNLLTSILGNVSLARMHPEQGPDIETLLRDTEKATLRARDIAQQLLTFARGGVPVRKATDIRGLIREAAAFAQSGSSALCEFDIPADLHPADVDAGQLSQVIHNLVLNAVQAMPAGGRVFVSCRNLEVRRDQALPLNPGPYVVLSIRDQGQGIPPEQALRIFDPYFSTKVAGSGLGLSVCHSIVKQHDGHIGLESKPGQGATFSVYLPAVPEAPREEGGSEGARIRRGSGRVLFMDDDENVLKAADQMLKHLGYEVATARHGMEALGLVQAARDEGRPFEAVILDLTIPGGMGGAETLRRLLALDPEVPAIASSGYASDPVMANYRSFGFREALAKPYGMAQLSRVLAAAVTR